MWEWYRLKIIQFLIYTGDQVNGSWWGHMASNQWPSQGKQITYYPVKALSLNPETPLIYLGGADLRRIAVFSNCL